MYGADNEPKDPTLFDTTGAAMLGLLSIQASHLVDLELDVEAMAAIATATIEEREGTESHPTEAYRIKTPNLKNLTLHLSINELLRHGVPPHDESRTEGLGHSGISSVLIEFLSRFEDVSDLNVVLQLADGPNFEDDGARERDHGSGTFEELTWMREAEGAFEILRGTPRIRRLTEPGLQRVVERISLRWHTQEDGKKAPTG